MSRQLKSLRISGELMTVLVSGRRPPVLLEGLPPDAEIVAASYDVYRDQVILTFRHESFEPLDECSEPPPIEVKCTRITPMPTAEVGAN